MRAIKLFSLTLSLLAVNLISLKAQKFNWAFSLEPNWYQYQPNGVTDVEHDKSGNVIALGTSYLDINQTHLTDFDPGIGVVNHPDTASVFLAKYSGTGKLDWVIPQPSSEVNTLGVDNNGNSIIAGAFYNSPFDFDPDPNNNVTLTPTPNPPFNYSGDAFLVSYSNSGQLNWINQFKSPGYNNTRSTVDNMNNSVFVVQYKDSLILESVSSPDVTFKSPKSTYIMAKYNSSGNIIWTQHFEVHNNWGFWIDEILVSDSGSIYVTGHINDITDMDPGPGIHLLYRNQSGQAHNCFVAKYDHQGNFLWAHKMPQGGDGNNKPHIAVNSKDEVFYTIPFHGTIDTDPSNSTNTLTSNFWSDIYIVKFNSFGQHIWGKKIGGTGYERIRSIVCDNNDFVYITGPFSSDSIDMDPGPGQIWIKKNTSLSNNYYNTYIAKYDGLGTYQWAGNIGSDSILDITVNDMDHLFAGGSKTEGKSDLDPSRNSFLLDGGKVVLAKYSQGCEDYIYRRVDICENQNYLFPDGDSSSSATVDTSFYSNSQICDSLIITILEVNSFNTSISTFNDSLVSNELYSSYQWYDCDSNQLIFGETSRAFDPQKSGNYAVILTNGNCNDTSDCIFFKPVGIHDPISELAVNIYPNPFKDQITIQLKGMDENVEMTVFNVSGKAVLRQNLIHENSTIETSNLNQGIYIVQIQGQSYKEHIKMIKR